MMEHKNIIPEIRNLTEKELDGVSGGFAMNWAINWSSTVAGFTAGATYGAAGGPGGVVVGGLVGLAAGFAVGGIANIGYGLSSYSLSSRFRRRIRED